MRLHRRVLEEVTHVGVVQSIVRGQIGTDAEARLEAGLATFQVLITFGEERKQNEKEVDCE